MPDLDAALASRHPDRFRKHNMMLAVAGIAVENGRILLVRDSHGFWAGPGGWIDPGESPEQALMREVREELGVTAKVTGAFRPFIEWNVARSAEPAGFLLFFLGLGLDSRNFRLQPDEVTEARWFGPAEWAGIPMLPYVRALFDERIREWLGG